MLKPENKNVFDAMVNFAEEPVILYFHNFLSDECMQIYD